MIETNRRMKQMKGNHGCTTCGKHDDGDHWHDLLQSRTGDKLPKYDLVQICYGTEHDSETVWVEFEYVFNPQGNWLQRWLFRRFGWFHKPSGGWKMQRHFIEEAELKRVGKSELVVVKNETCLSDEEVVSFANHNTKRRPFAEAPWRTQAAE